MQKPSLPAIEVGGPRANHGAGSETGAGRRVSTACRRVCECACVCVQVRCLCTAGHVCVSAHMCVHVSVCTCVCRTRLAECACMSVCTRVHVSCVHARVCACACCVRSAGRVCVSVHVSVCAYVCRTHLAACACVCVHARACFVCACGRLRLCVLRAFGGACVRECAHTCTQTRPPSLAQLGRAVLSPRPFLWAEHQALRSSLMITLLIDSLTLDRSLKFSVYSSARGKTDMRVL